MGDSNFIPVSTSAVAALFYLEDVLTTLYSKFPFLDLHNVCNISMDSNLVQEISSASLILLDEIVMTHAILH